jgi:glucosamine kinase
MMLIADSGATKADWRFIDKSESVHSFSTIGFNPLFWTTKQVTTEIIKSFPKRIKTEISKQKSRIYYYGTSCSSKERKKIIYTALNKIFPKSKIVVDHDMLAAAHAICGDQKGIAAILGTGSNSCYYDGKKITGVIGGFAFILGDEGSGAHLGLEFIKAFLNNELSEKVRKAFLKEYRLTKDKIFDNVYNKKSPNRFLATFAKFIYLHVDDPFLQRLVRNSFAEFFEKTICKYENHKHVPVGFVGSIASNFKDILYEVAKENGVTINKITRNPIEELVKYHLSQN